MVEVEGDQDRATSVRRERVERGEGEVAERRDDGIVMMY
jgi:hypothetical protein